MQNKHSLSLKIFCSINFIQNKIAENFKNKINQHRISDKVIKLSDQSHFSVSLPCRFEVAKILLENSLNDDFVDLVGNLETSLIKFFVDEKIFELIFWNFFLEFQKFEIRKIEIFFGESSQRFLAPENFSLSLEEPGGKIVKFDYEKGGSKGDKNALHLTWVSILSTSKLNPRKSPAKLRQQSSQSNS